tara:strand:- start:1335 stop:1523 length:189 start_codon:yes stop_codon:yes gene_type:complete
MIKEIIDIIPNTIKNFGQINLRKILASLVLIISLIPGATSKDWKRTNPIIIPAFINGIIFNI